MKKNLSIVFLFLIHGVYSAESAVITFDFSSATGANPTWNVYTIDPNATSTGFADGSGITAKSGSGEINATEWNTTSPASVSSALSGNDYFGFIITPKSGYVADLNGASLTLTLQRSTTGPADYAIFSSVGGFTDSSDALQTGTVGTTATQITYNFTSSSYDNLTGGVEFRIYGDGASSGGGTMDITTLSLGGIISPVPEPGTWGAISGAGLLGLCGMRAWRQRRQQNAAV
jgi:hypothetical protein